MKVLKIPEPGDVVEVESTGERVEVAEVNLTWRLFRDTTGLIRMFNEVVCWHKDVSRKGGPDVNDKGEAWTERPSSPRAG